MFTVATWDPAQYLQFERERSQPARDLIARIADRSFPRIIDLGCGTGTSTFLLHQQWPSARITGLDSSASMIAAARKGNPGLDWIQEDIRTWTSPEPIDLVFSNAALHWVPDHDELFPRLVRNLAPGGTLAVQMPINSDSPAHRAIRTVAEASGWSTRWGPEPLRARVAPAERYYDLLAPHCSPVQLWETEYVHVMPSTAAIVEWVKGTTLRPYLDALPAKADQEEFLRQIGELVAAGYPLRPDGRVLFPFRRLFLVAVR
jgi:trans-aconitate 2-methyltransferase